MSMCLHAGHNGRGVGKGVLQELHVVKILLEEYRGVFRA